MKKIKVSEATPRQIDWLVAKEEGCFIDTLDEHEGPWLEGPAYTGDFSGYRPSTDPAQGQPLLEREKIETGPASGAWRAVPNREGYPGNDAPWFFGPTMLIAGLRCFCASRLGEEVEVPEELLT